MALDRRASKSGIGKQSRLQPDADRPALGKREIIEAFTGVPTFEERRCVVKREGYGVDLFLQRKTEHPTEQKAWNVSASPV